MPFRSAALATVLLPGLLAAQVPTHPDTMQMHDTLTRTPVNLQAITVNASATPPDAPLSVVRITPAVIASTPATDNWDLLRQAAGVEVHEQGQGIGFASDMSIRGFSSDHSTDVALWIDGVPINEPVNGHAEGYDDWSLLMPQAVETMEVIKGPASALYGNFAMAGAVNVRTRDRMSGDEFTLNGGANGRVDGTFFTGLDEAHTGLVIGIRGMRDGGWRPNSDEQLGQFYGRFVHDLSPSATLDVGTELYASGWNSPGFLSVDQYNAQAYDNVTNTSDGGFKRHALERASLRLIMNPNLLWRTTTYATQGSWNFYLTIPPEPGTGEGTGSQTQEIDHRSGWGATSALTWSGDRTEITAGAEGRLDNSAYQRWFTTNRTEDSADAIIQARQLSGALFVQSTEDVGHHIRFSLGGRYDLIGTNSTSPGDTTLSASHGVFSPKLGGLVHVPRIGEVYVDIARGFRSTDGVIEDPTLPFITEWSYESGVRFTAHQVTGSVAVFQIDVSNEQTFDPVLLMSTSGGRSRRQGAEMTLATPLGPFARLSGSFTLTNAKYLDQVTDDGDDAANTPVANTAKYVGSATLAVGRRTAPWAVEASTNVVGDYTPFDELGVVVPGYALFHLSGRLLVGKSTTLRLGIRNLFNTAYPELRAGGFVSPGQPRAVYGGLSYGR